jgi:WD40 repeat protein
VTASDDQTARLWDAASGKELHIVRHEGSVSSAQFSSDGKTVVTASGDKAAQLWRCDACGPIDEIVMRLNGVSISLSFIQNVVDGQECDSSGRWR